MEASASFEVRRARSSSDPTHQTWFGKSGSEQTGDAGRTLRLGPFVLR
jgi:hypothetical protein